MKNKKLWIFIGIVILILGLNHIFGWSDYLGEKENPTNTRRWTVYWITTAKPEFLRLRCFYFNSVQSILVTWNIYSPHHSLAGLLAYSFNAHCCLPDISVT